MTGPLGTLACLSCRSEIGLQVREAIFGEDFGAHLAFTFLPFAILGGIVAAIHFTGRGSSIGAAPPEG